MGQKLPREVFLALAAVGWIDGKLEDREADAIARAAVDEGLDLAEIEAIEKAVRSKLEFRDIDVSQLSPAERLYVYAMASWIAALDGTIAPSERVVLDAIGFELRLTAKGRASMDEAVRELLARPEGTRPERFDLAGLKRAIEARVHEAAEAAKVRAAEEKSG
jgi:hypothetical protein